MAPRAALRVAEGSSPAAPRPRALRARWRASSGVSTPARPKASFRVLPAEFRYWTTHVRAPDGLALSAKPDRSSSRYSVSRCTGFKASTNRLVSLGKAASARAGRRSSWPGTLRGHIRGKARAISRVSPFVLILAKLLDAASSITLQQHGE